MNLAMVQQSALDQRWAELRDWVWEQDAQDLARFDAMLNAEDPRPLLVAVASRPEIARTLRRLAALALDEALVRGLPGEDG